MVTFAGNPTKSNELDCIFIFDQVTKTFSLEKLTSTLRVNASRGKKAPRSNGTSSNSPPSNNTPISPIFRPQTSDENAMDIDETPIVKPKPKPKPIFPLNNTNNSTNTTKNDTLTTSKKTSNNKMKTNPLRKPKKPRAKKPLTLTTNTSTSTSTKNEGQNPEFFDIPSLSNRQTVGSKTLPKSTIPIENEMEEEISDEDDDEDGFGSLANELEAGLADISAEVGPNSLIRDPMSGKPSDEEISDADDDDDFYYSQNPSNMIVVDEPHAQPIATNGSVALGGNGTNGARSGPISLKGLYAPQNGSDDDLSSSEEE